MIVSPFYRRDFRLFVKFRKLEGGTQCLFGVAMEFLSQLLLYQFV